MKESRKESKIKSRCGEERRSQTKRRLTVQHIVQFGFDSFWILL